MNTTETETPDTCGACTEVLTEDRQDGLCLRCFREINCCWDG